MFHLELGKLLAQGNTLIRVFYDSAREMSAMMLPQEDAYNEQVDGSLLWLLYKCL